SGHASQRAGWPQSPSVHPRLTLLCPIWESLRNYTCNTSGSCLHRDGICHPSCLCPLIPTSPCQPARGEGPYLPGVLGALVALDSATRSLIMRVVSGHLLTVSTL